MATWDRFRHMDLIGKVEETQSQLSLFATRSDNSPKYRADLVELQRRGHEYRQILALPVTPAQCEQKIDDGEVWRWIRKTRDLLMRCEHCYSYTMFHLQDADSCFKIHYFPKDFATLDQGKSIGIMS
jgi:hypothetical protein